VSIERLPPPISTKSSKEVNEIFKYFKAQNLLQAKTSIGKLFTQVSKLGSNTEEVLRIKEVFPSLKANKIENIQKIIKDDSKFKLYINITTKSPPRKQVVVPMNSNNNTNFIKESSAHVTNMNRALRNIK